LLKLLFEELVAFLALLVVFPFGIIISVIMKFTGKGYTFCLKSLMGKDGKIFNLLKFSTMLAYSSNIGPGDITLHNYPLGFPFGRFLRKTKFNKLPQLINVLQGYLSIVGLRPQTSKNFVYYPEETINVTP
jgi:lipopolysaccharide/colanic/teichoic acid biosynthesis glycosyltransferase